MSVNPLGKGNRASQPPQVIPPLHKLPTIDYANLYLIHPLTPLFGNQTLEESNERRDSGRIRRTLLTPIFRPTLYRTGNIDTVLPAGHMRRRAYRPLCGIFCASNS